MPGAAKGSGREPTERLCARCGHGADAHVGGVCKGCWTEEQRWGHVLLTAPTHTYADPTVPSEVQRAQREKIEATKRALYHKLADKDRRFDESGPA
jgi:predicted amidophosphoribosyltransferase